METSSSSSSSSSTPKRKRSPQNSRKTKTPVEKKVEEEQVTASPEFSYFTKYELPTQSWFEKQIRAGDTSNMAVAEFFHLIGTADSKEEQVKLLRMAKTDRVLMTLLNMNYTPSLYGVFNDFSKEEVLKNSRINPLPWGLNSVTIRGEYRRLDLFFSNSNRGKSIDKKKKLAILYELTESLHRAEATILVECMTQSLTVPGLDHDLIQAAFGKSRFP